MPISNFGRQIIKSIGDSFDAPSKLMQSKLGEPMNCPCMHAEENVKTLSNRWTSLDGLVKDIITYYEARGLKWPSDYGKSMMWFNQERAEAEEIYLAKEGGWVRNHPEEAPEWNQERFTEELGDMLMMVIVAGLVEGVDPVTALRNKMKQKLGIDG